MSRAAPVGDRPATDKPRVRGTSDSSQAAPGRLSSLPRLNPAAYHGIAGEIVSAIAPGTEADPAALLVSVLAAAGAMIGDGPHVMIGAARHPARVWPLIIGRTASGRKGESWSQAEDVVVAADEGFAARRLASGLSTGEGIIACFAEDKDPADGTIRSLPDKRLLVVESEFARPLAAARREGSTLSPALRDLWDRGRAGIMTRGAPLHCHGAHLVIVAHVTPRELLAKVSESDISGGLLNRFLPVLVQRPHLLPNPGAVDVMGLGVELGTRTVKARAAGRQMRRDAAADGLWADAYTAMARDEADGALGEILARGPAYAMRLALTYALLDSARAIGEEHLRAGLAVWEYASASARRVFADRTSKTGAEMLADFLADSPGGRTRTEIRDLFGRNRDARQIDALIEELGENVATEEDRGEPGRPVTRVYWTSASRTSLGALLAGEPATRSLFANASGPMTLRPGRFNDIPRSEGTETGRTQTPTTYPQTANAQVRGDKSSGRTFAEGEEIRARRTGRPPLPEDKRRQILSLHAEGRWTMAQIGAHAGVAKSTVHKIIHAAGES
jgi:hypothetical protein